MKFLHGIVFKGTILAASLSPVLTSAATAESVDDEKPNLIMIMTDEHNLRTLQCYRALMDDEQAYQWGGGVEVETPHIDSLARDGAIFTNFYTVTPRKSISRQISTL